MKMSEEGRKFADALQKVGQLQTGDLGVGVMKMADIHRSIEGKRDQVTRSIQEDVITSLQKSAKADEMELTQFENDYKRNRDACRQKMAKLEGNSKKAGKKGAAALQEAIKELDVAVKEADKIKADKLRNVLLLERKKFCNLLTQMGMFVSSEVDMFSEGMRFKEQQSYFSNLSSSNSNLPNDLEALINSQAQERTFVQIQGGDEGGGYSGGYSGGSTDYTSSYDTSYDTGYNAPGGYGNSQGTCTALYDFAGDQPTDLPFYAGEVVTITAEDDGSGWMTGELNGRSGIFPSSYVQRN